MKESLPYRIYYKEFPFHDSLILKWVIGSMPIAYNRYLIENHGLVYDAITTEYIFDSMEEYNYFLLKFT